MSNVAWRRYKCQMCNDEFKSSRDDAKFCSSACRQLAHRIQHGKSKRVRSKQVIGPSKFPPGSFDRK